MPLLENDHFLVELGKLFQKSRVGGPQAVIITLKHCKFLFLFDLVFFPSSISLILRCVLLFIVDIDILCG